MRVKQGAFKKHKRMAVTILEEPALIYSTIYGCAVVERFNNLTTTPSLFDNTSFALLHHQPAGDHGNRKDRTVSGNLSQSQQESVLSKWQQHKHPQRDAKEKEFQPRQRSKGRHRRGRTGDKTG
jgi:hypothetical protein